MGQFGMGAKYKPDTGTTAYGFPLNGNVNANLTQEEFESIPHVLNVQVRVFDLSNTTDLKEYTDVRDRIANKQYVQLDRTKMLSTDGREIKIHLEWAEVQGVLPKHLQRRL